MRFRLLLILALSGAVWTSLVVGTLSGFTNQTAYSATVVPDTAAIRRLAGAKQKEQADSPPSDERQPTASQPKTGPQETQPSSEPTQAQTETPPQTEPADQAQDALSSQMAETQEEPVATESEAAKAVPGADASRQPVPSQDEASPEEPPEQAGRGIQALLGRLYRWRANFS